MFNESGRRFDMWIFNIKTKENKRKKIVHNKFDRAAIKHLSALIFKALFKIEAKQNRISLRGKNICRSVCIIIIIKCRPYNNEFMDKIKSII